MDKTAPLASGNEAVLAHHFEVMSDGRDKDHNLQPDNRLWEGPTVLSRSHLNDSVLSAIQCSPAKSVPHVLSRQSPF